MVTQFTEGIEVCVETFFQPQHSNANTGEYVFAYRIIIRNTSKYTIQLLSRYWRIVDGTSLPRIVQGKGVIGEQPIILPGQEHTYISGCHLKSDIGMMEGHYLMHREDGADLKVIVPPFVMVAPGRLN